MYTLNVTWNFEEGKKVKSTTIKAPRGLSSEECDLLARGLLAQSVYGDSIFVYYNYVYKNGKQAPLHSASRTLRPNFEE